MKKKILSNCLLQLLMAWIFCMLSFAPINQLYAQIGPDGTPQNGLTAYYPFDGATGNNAARERVTNLTGNNASFTNPNVAFNANGVRGNSLQINGANLTGTNATANPAATFPGIANATVNGINEYSVSFWFKPNTNPNLVSPVISLLSKRTNCTNNAIFWDLRIRTNQPAPNQGIINYGHEILTNTTPAANNNAGARAVDGNCWNHVVITRAIDNGMATSRIYINGTLESTDNALAVQNINDTAVLGISGSGCINTGNPDGTVDYNGLFDELMVYNRPLTEAEVTELNTAFIIANCCPARNNANYLQIRADQMTAAELAEAASYGIRPRIAIQGQTTTDLWVMGDGATHILPNKVFIGDDVTLEVRNGSTIDFTNSDVVLGNCAGIAINAGNAIAHNATFRPCDEFGSWRGIAIANSFTNVPTGIAYPNSNPSLTFNECTFVNAQEAFYTTTRVTGVPIELNLTNNVFTNCHRGMVVNSTPSANSLSFSGTITGNTIQIDDQVSQINYCNIMGTPDDFIGLLFVDTHLRQLLIGSNKFIDATRTISDLHFEGINLTRTSLADIANNQFTNNDRAIVLMETNQISIENNTFEVTRRSSADEIGVDEVSSYQLTYQGPTGGSQAQRALFKGNKFLNSADVETSSIDFANGQLGSGAIYVTGTARWITIEENEIDGFEVGIFADMGSSTAAQIRNNHIKAYNFGILQRGITYRAFFPDGRNIFTMHIACNQIDMYKSAVNSGLPVEGIRIMGIGAPNQNSGISALEANLVVEGNCVSNTNIAINMIAGHNSGSWGYVRMPTLRHNYLYNYRDAGLRAENIVGGNLSNNSFIGNNTSDDVRQVITSGSGGALNANNNDFGDGLAQVVGNVLVGAIASSPSGASCGNQDIGNINNTLRCNDDIGMDTGGSSGVISQRTTTSPTLTANFKNAFNEIHATNKRDALGVAITGIEIFEDMQDVDKIYQAASAKTWENNQKGWLNYHYSLRNEDYANAKRSLNSINSEDQNEEDKIEIAVILLNQSETLKDLSEADLSMLKSIMKGDGAQAPIARNILHVTKGGYPYSYPKVVISQQKDSDISDVVDFNEHPISLYPNPVQDKVSLHISEIGNQDWKVATIYNIMGNFIEQKEIGANLVHFDLENLSPGLYFITLRNSAGKKVTTKFIKK